MSLISRKREAGFLPGDNPAFLAHVDILYLIGVYQDIKTLGAAPGEQLLSRDQ